ncbi:MAG: ATP-binding protein [Bifidobacteriaceae bacterium]|jgi:hypothetical protein|nr:ATP-binding protein [Bifidobacteriaceae bacterium]
MCSYRSPAEVVAVGANLGAAVLQILGGPATGIALGMQVAGSALGLVPENQRKEFERSVQKLGRKGWEAVEKRRSDGHLERDIRLPSWESTVDYLKTCMVGGRVFTAEGLRQWTERQERAAGLVVEAIKREYSTNPEMVVIQRVAVLADALDSLRAPLHTSRARADEVEHRLTSLAEAMEELQVRRDQVERLVGELRSVLENQFARYLLTQRPFPEPTNSPLYFTSGKVPFQGREAELAQLEAFCDSDPKLAWWAVTGPGGTGKSRLAYEFCQRMAERGWRAQFLPREFFDKTRSALTEWTYPGNLLLVIDYVAAQGEAVGSWLAELDGQLHQHKLRLLLLEREPFDSRPFGLDPAWYTSMTTRADSRQLNRTCHQANGADRDLKLGELTANDMKAIAQAAEMSEALAAQAIGRLSQIDPDHQRPLYLLLLIQAWKAGQPWERWNLAELSDFIYEHERLRLPSAWPRPRQEAALNACAYATVRGSIPDLTAAMTTDDYLVSIQDDAALVDGVHEFARQIKSLFGSANAAVVRYEPDIPGEYIALRRMQEIWNTSPAALTAFLTAAWTKASPNVADFLRRAATDFGSSGTFEDMFTEDRLLQRPPSESIFDYAAALVGICGTANRSIAYGCAELLKGLSAQDPRNPGIAFRRAAGLVNLSVEQDLAGCERTVGELRDLAGGFPGDRGIAERLAKGLVNLGVEQDLAGCERTVGELRDLAGRFPGDRGIAERLAKGLVNLSAEQDLAGRERTVGELRDLAGRFPGDRGIAEQFAMGLVNLGAGQDLAGRERTVGELRDLADRFSGDRGIALCLAVGLFNLGAGQDLAGCERTVGELRDLAGGFPGDRGVALCLAVGLFNLGAEQGLAGREATVRELKALAKRFPEDPDLDELLGYIPGG